MSTLKVAIIGFGIGGAALALLLGKRGHTVSIFERRAATHPAGGGLLLSPAGQQALRALGLFEPALALGATISSIQTRGQHGEPILDLRYSRWQSGAFGLGLQRGALLQLLRQRAAGSAQVHFQCPVRVSDPQQGLLEDDNGVVFGPYDLIIGADGRHAASRTATAQPPAMQAYVWGARLCLLDDPACSFNDRLIQRYHGHHQLAIWPVGSASADAPRRINLSWRTEGLGHSKHFDQALWQQELLQLAPELRPLLSSEASGADVMQVSYGAVASSCWGTGRLILLGDAAHAMSPQLGQGASLALQDAWALAECVQDSSDPATILRKFVSRREPQTRRYRHLSRLLTPLYQSPHPIARWLRERTVPTLARLPLFEAQMLRTLAGAAG